MKISQCDTVVHDRSHHLDICCQSNIPFLASIISYQDLSLLILRYATSFRMVDTSRIPAQLVAGITKVWVKMGMAKNTQLRSNRALACDGMYREQSWLRWKSCLFDML